MAFEVATDSETILASMVAVIHPNMMQDDVRLHEVLYPEGVEDIPGFEPDIFMALSSHAPLMIAKTDTLLNRPLPWDSIPGFQEQKKEYEQLWPEVVQDSLRSVMGLQVNRMGTTNYEVARYLLTGQPYWN